jgi:hypothetical protein
MEMIQAFQLRDWYALAALSVALFVQVIRKMQGTRELWRLVPDGYRWLIPVALGACVGFIQAYQEGKSWQAALIVALGGALGIGVPAMGVHAAMKESWTPSNGKANGNGSSNGAAMLLLFALALPIEGCATWKPVARTANDLAREACAIYFSERQGISVEEAARGVCTVRDIVDPFLREILKAQERAGVEALARVDK